MKQYIAPEAKPHQFHSLDVISSSYFTGIYDENQNSYDFWDLQNGFGEQFGDEDNGDGAVKDW